MLNTTLTIDGAAISGIPSFYDEINRVFMAEEDWKLGPSLDAFNDMLYGNYGAAQGDGPVTLVWDNIEKSNAALGIEATREFYRDKLKRPDIFSSEQITKALAALESNGGPTYFDIILDIIADHPRIELVAGR